MNNFFPPPPNPGGSLHYVLNDTGNSSCSNPRSGDCGLCACLPGQAGSLPSQSAPTNYCGGILVISAPCQTPNYIPDN